MTKIGRPVRARRLLRYVAVAAVVVVTAACTSAGGRGVDALSVSSDPASAPSGGPTSGATSSSGSSDTSSSASTSSSSSSTPVRPTPPPTTRPPKPVSPSSPAAVLARMTLPQRVGQLLMVDCPSTGYTVATRRAILRYHVGSVILDGNTTAGRPAVRAVINAVQGLAPRGIKLLISTDQEGGYVQRLQGPRFARIPSALEQGRLTRPVLRGNARLWARQLQLAGVNVNLAPVMDVVPPNFGSNPPIGDLDREYGHDPTTVFNHAIAFARGMMDSHVAPAVKHFPGLGRVRGNTDYTGNVQDTVTTANDPYIRPFADAVASGVPIVMVSTAIYDRIDPTEPAIFSYQIVTQLLRKQLGFGGVIMTDSVGGTAQMAPYRVPARAVRFLRAGGDLVLTTDANQAAVMTQAIIQRARTVPTFRAKVNAAALRVLTLKSQLGLLSG